MNSITIAEETVVVVTINKQQVVKMIQIKR